MFGLPTINAQISIKEEPNVRALMSRYETLGKEEDHINGWRIKLVSTTNRRELDQARFLLQRVYPTIAYSQSYENPYYSLKVGAFETRIDIEPLLAQMKVDFPEAIPFRDEVMKSELFAPK